MTGVPTTNYGFSKIDFNSRPWDSDEHANWDLLDAILYTIAQVPNIAGVWRNSTQYQVGQNVLDPNTLVFYQCLLANVSAATGTFAADRTANPTNWTLTNSGQGSVRYDMGQALSNAQILQAQNNLTLFAQFLRFDAPQTLTYNNMLQVLNTLGIDGLETGIASAATTDISNVNTQAVAITGTTTITSLGVRPNKYKLIRFTGSLTLTNSSTLNLPGGANIVTQAGDTCVAFSDSATPTANWTIRSYSRGDGAALNPNIPSDIPRGNAVQSLSQAVQATIRQNISVGSLDDIRTLAVQVAKLKASALRYPNYISDDFADYSGLNTSTSVNANISNGRLLNQLADLNTKSLLHLNGTTGSTSIVDVISGNTWSVVGNAQISTAQSLFGGASLRITSGTDAILLPTATATSPGSGDFTHEFDVYPTTVTAQQGLLDTRISGTANNGICLLITTAGKIQYITGNAVAITSAASIAANTHSRIRLTRTGGQARLFINGVLDSTVADTTSYPTSMPIRLGNTYDGGSPLLNGWLDEYRYSNSARSTADYTLDTSEFAVGTSGNLDARSILAPTGQLATKAALYIAVGALSGTLTPNTNFVAKFTRTGIVADATPFNLVVDTPLSGYNIYKAALDCSAQPSTAATPGYQLLTTDPTLSVAIDYIDVRWS